MLTNFVFINEQLSVSSRSIFLLLVYVPPPHKKLISLFCNQILNVLIHSCLKKIILISLRNNNKTTRLQRSIQSQGKKVLQKSEQLMLEVKCSSAHTEVCVLKKVERRSDSCPKAPPCALPAVLMGCCCDRVEKQV